MAPPKNSLHQDAVDALSGQDALLLLGRLAGKVDGWEDTQGAWQESHQAATKALTERIGELEDIVKELKEALGELAKKFKHETTIQTIARVAERQPILAGWVASMLTIIALGVSVDVLRDWVKVLLS